MNITLYKTVFGACLLSLILTFAAFGQTSNQAQTLLPGQTLEREMTGAETHLYKLDLQKNEFFQVRVEQKGVDVSLKLIDTSGSVLATMDSPNGKEGFETLSFIAEKSGSFVLEASSFDAKAKKANYTIKREVSRKATEKDKRRVEAEQLFVEGIKARDTEGQAEIAVAKLGEALKGWQELNDNYLVELTNKTLTEIKENKYYATFLKLFQELQRAEGVLDEGTKLSYKAKEDSLSGRAKLTEALALFRIVETKVFDNGFEEKIKQAGKESQRPLNLLRWLQFNVKSDETHCFNGIAQTHYNFSEWEKYIDYKKLALAGYQEILSDKSLSAASINPQFFLQIRLLEVSTLDLIGGALDRYFGKSEEAINYLNQSGEHSRMLYQETQDPRAKLLEAGSLRQIAVIYRRESRNNIKAIEFFTKALEIYRTFPDKKTDEANILSAIASGYMISLQYKEAKKNYEDALQLYREIDDKFGQSQILQMLGVMYTVLNNKSEISNYFNQSLVILQSADYAENFKKNFNKHSGDFKNIEIWEELNKEFIEYERLGSIGLSYRFLENHPKALEFYEKTLAVARSRKEIRAIRQSLVDVGRAFEKMEKWNEASNYYLQALEISRKQEAKEDIAYDLQDVGLVLLEMGKPREALKYQNEALSAYQSVGVDENKAFSISYSSLLNEISRTHYALGNKRLAIFYGKRAVNSMQGERQRLQNLDPISRKGFLGRKENHYRRVADWLILEGRLPEAQQVLNSFKDQQFFDFDQTQIKPPAPLSLTPREADFVERFGKTGERVGAIGSQLKELKLKVGGRQPSVEENSQLQKLEGDLKTASDDFFTILKQAESEFSKPADEKDNVGEVSDLAQMQTALRELNKQTGQKAVAVYQLVGEDNFSALLITPNGIEKVSAPIKGAELNEKAKQLWALLQSDKYDTTKLSKEIYDVVFKSLETKLPKDTTTIMWSMDGNLRYVPMAALFDGKKFLIERYNHAVFTRAEQERMTRNVSSVWTGTGFGSSQSATVNNSGDKISFVALPGVREELSAIFKNQKSGILEGAVFPDEKFSMKNFLDAMKQKRPLVHIASHFSFRAGDEARSFLLMGDGTTFTLEEMKHKTNLFQGVELLTLSACNTAAQQAGADGREIDGFAELAQRLGAGAVMATLWQVSDASTPWLMRDFYATRQGKSGMNKATALQKSQLGLLNGTAKIKPLESNVKGSSTPNVIVVVTPDGKPDGDTRGAEIVYVESNDAPLFKKDDKKPFAHPFYWSPFVLIGNWK